MGRDVSVAVVIPVRDGASTIVRAVQSVLQQGFPGAEVVVVDDGSTDGSARAVEDLRAEAVTVVRTEPSGAARARNHGAAHTGARWLVFLDADDEAEADQLRTLLDGADESTALVCAPTVTILPDGGTVVGRPPEPSRHLINRLTPGAFAVARDVFEAIGGYEGSLGFGENTDLEIRLVDQCRRQHRTIQVLDRPTVRIWTAETGVRAARYADVMLHTSNHFLSHHRRALDEEGTTALYASTGGVAAARLGDWPGARSRFLLALRSPGRRWSDLGRLLLTFLPPIASRVWSVG
jgi:glycosyltransferase involved in cell wall biosynthesis